LPYILSWYNKIINLREMKSKKEQFKIKLAKTKKDLEGILYVQVETWVDAYTNVERGITRPMIREHYKRKLTKEYIRERYESLKDKNKRNWIALDANDHVIGWVGCSKEGKNKGGFGIYVLPKYQRLGLGKKLMAKGLKWLSTQKYMEIGVVEYNKIALNFYKKLGFHLIGKEEDFKVGDFVGKGWVVVMRRTCSNLN
jgi:ribosomal protein S18 acetylase RimI-like enzyme